MSKAAVGDLICWSAQSQYSPMKFGRVYSFDMNKNVRVERLMRDGTFGTKQEASGNYLVIAREGDTLGIPSLDDKIWAAIAAYVKN